MSHRTLSGRKLELYTQQWKKKQDQIHALVTTFKKARVTTFSQEIEILMYFVASVVVLIRVVVMHQFLDVSNSVRMVTTSKTIFKWNHEYVSFLVSQAMVMLIVP